MPCKKRHDRAGNACEENMTILQGRCFRTESSNAAEHASPRPTRSLRHLRGRPTTRRVRREAGSPAAVKEIVEGRGSGRRAGRCGRLRAKGRDRGWKSMTSGRGCGPEWAEPRLRGERGSCSSCSLGCCQRSSGPTGVQLSRIAGGKRRSPLRRRGPAPSGSPLQPLREGTVWWC